MRGRKITRDRGRRRDARRRASAPVGMPGHPVSDFFEPPEAQSGDLSLLRECLRRHGYTAEAILARLGVDSLAQATSPDARARLGNGAASLDAWIRLFLFGESLPSRPGGGFTDDALALVQNLGLLARDEDGALRPRALLYPVGPVYVVSDRLDRVGRGPGDAADDTVYPAFTDNTRQFLSLLPDSPCERLLDLGTGCGVGALCAAASAGQVWATDISPRAARFTRFNAALNGVTNITTGTGDLYEPVEGLTFDRIIAHPPYMPALRQSVFFQDGGPDGEQVTRRLLAGLGGHLAPGGQCFVTCTLSDRGNRTVETRVRDMLGPPGRELDIAVIAASEYHPVSDFAGRLWAGQAGAAEIEPVLEALRATGATNVVFGTIVIQRKDAGRPAVTVRRRAGPRTTARDVQQALRWAARTREPGFPDDLMELPVRAVSGTVLSVHQRLEEGRWAPEAWVLATQAPFLIEGRCEAWVGSLLARATSEPLTVREHFTRLKSEGILEERFGAAEFAAEVGRLLSIGVLSPADQQAAVAPDPREGPASGA